MDTGKVMLPEDFVVLTGSEKSVVDRGHVKPDQHIVDTGPRTLDLLQEEIRNASFILWNGPLGNYEQGFTEPTEELARMIAAQTHVSKGKTYSVVGGGDTLAAIAKLDIESYFSFVSTGGGAMLDLLANGTLPGIEALK
jgi:phosphoglycerate kinase